MNGKCCFLYSLIHIEKNPMFSLLLSGKQKIIDSQIVFSAQLSEINNACQATGCCLNKESKLWTHKKTEIPVYLLQSYMSF